ncbi:MAG TPA: integrase core domain-containing protein, partial [Gemmataceae bacterium]|nr:integrase core domain-containing protein [Gemmataceae bacterium]
MGLTIFVSRQRQLRPTRVLANAATWEPWVKQITRNLTATEDGFLNGKRYLIMDRDTTFSKAFRGILSEAGVEPVLLPPHSPNLNANLERFHRTIKAECLERLILFSEAPLRHVVVEFLEHYHSERNHQGLNNQLIESRLEVGQ